MKQQKIISFPHLGNYYIPIRYLLKHLTKHKIMSAPPITKKTIELGNKYSPDFVCIPFKYNLGNFIEALDNGANILIQAGGGCRYGYYSEVQEQILKDLGYHFEFYNLTGDDHFTFRYLYKTFKKLNPKINIFKFIHYLLMTLLMIYCMDKIDEYIRENIGFELIKNSFEQLQKNMFQDFVKINNPISLFFCYLKYKQKFKRLPIHKPKNCLKVGVIGELYTSMEPYASYYLEKQLASMNIEVKRFTNVTYLLITKRFQTKKLLRQIKKYCKYTIGADGMDNVFRAKYLAEKGFDGLIHIKPFGCTPEIGAIPILQRVSEDYKIPIIYFSFDNQTSTEGMKTRLEAFYDMLKVRKEKEIDKSLYGN